MASSLKHIVVFLLISLFTTASARESQFFSKVTKETSSSQKVPSSTEQQQKQTTTFTNNEQQQIKQEEPTFVPQTTGDSYGLYGHETGQFAPGAETTTTNSNSGTPYRTTVDSEEKSVFESESPYGNINNMNYDNNNDNGESLYSNNKNNYEQQENTYEQYNNNNNNNNNNENSNKYTYNKDSYVTDEERARSVGTTNSAAVSNQEGMSDTRFVEGGKYFYDVNNEQKYYPTYRYENWRTRSTNSEGYNNNLNGNGGYTANNHRNSNSEYNNGNSMDGGAYGQNQEEFQEVQEELEP